MAEETTNGENTSEQEKSPAPAGKKFFKPVDENWKYNPKTPLNYRPKGVQIPFMEALIREKGSQNVALEHCVLIAMDVKGKMTVGKVVEAKSAAPTDQSKLIADLRKQLTDLKTTEALSKLVFDKEHTEFIEKIKTKKKLSMDEAIRYALKYTAKNDWL